MEPITCPYCGDVAVASQKKGLYGQLPHDLSVWMQCVNARCKARGPVANAVFEARAKFSEVRREQCDPSGV